MVIEDNVILNINLCSSSVHLAIEIEEMTFTLNNTSQAGSESSLPTYSGFSILRLLRPLGESDLVMYIKTFMNERQ